MKKFVYVFLSLLMAAVLAGCGNGSTAKPQNSSGNSVSSVIEQQMAQSDTAQSSETPQPLPQEDGSAKKDAAVSAAADVDVDVDLTKLSSTMVYSEVLNMMSNPEEYIGKTVKMAGQFLLFQATDENGQPVPDQIYYSCVIADATACCLQGLEFVLADAKQYPEDYPEPGSAITVTGEFQTYMEDQYLYCHLVNAQLA